MELDTNKSFLYNNCMVSQALVDALNGFAAQYGKNVYLDRKWLENQLKNKNVPNIDIYRVMLLVNTNGFEKIIKSDKDITHNDIDMFVVNACNSTGLLRPLILQLLDVIFSSLGKVLGIDDKGGLSVCCKDNQHIIAPFQIFRQELLSLRYKYTMGDIDDEFYSLLSELYMIGLPKAYYIHGKIRCDTDDLQVMRMGLEDIKIAADMGDSEALRYLGRYYYNKGTRYWRDSYSYYTGLGTAMLEEEDRENYADIKNHIVFNKIILRLGVVLFFISFVLFIMIPDFDIFSGQRLFGAFCLITEIGLILYEYYRYNKNPFGNQFISVLLVYCIWMIYIGIKVGI